MKALTADERHTRIEELKAEYVRQKAVVEKSAKQARGRTFEQLVREVFRAHGLLLRDDYHTKQNRDEQVDGAIELPNGRIALIEAKWVESKEMAASDLFSFVGKVENKFAGTVGIFISHPELKENFLRALRYGRRQSVAVMHGPDIDSLFDPQFPLVAYLTDLFRYLSTDNLVHIPVEEWDPSFFHAPTASNGRIVGPQAGGNDLGRLVAQCVTDPDVRENAHEQAKKLAAIDPVGSLVEVFEALRGLKTGFRDRWKRDALVAVGRELIDRLPDEQTAADLWFFDHVSGNFRYQRLPEFRALFVERWKYLDEKSVEKYESRLKNQWKTHFGDYSAENDLSERMGDFWGVLSEKTRAELAKEYLAPILASDRGTDFPQWRFAKKVLGDAANFAKYVWPVVQALAERRATTLKNIGYNEVDAVDLLSREFDQIRSLAEDFEDRLSDAIAPAYA